MAITLVTAVLRRNLLIFLPGLRSWQVYNKLFTAESVRQSPSYEIFMKTQKADAY